MIAQQTRSSFGLPVVRTYYPSYNPKTGVLYFVCPDNYKKNSFHRLNFPKVFLVDREVENTLQVKSSKVATVLEWGLRSPTAGIRKESNVSKIICCCGIWLNPRSSKLIVLVHISIVKVCAIKIGLSIISVSCSM